jgi:tetratricopeptide (TPR) repeat protein
MMHLRRLAAAASWASLLLSAPNSWAAPRSGDVAASGDAIRPAAERTLSVASPPKPTRPIHDVVREGGSSGRPMIRGPKVPEVLRRQLQSRLDARVDADLAETRALRREATDLLTKFVAESPRDAREMPEALVRLGELAWETERDQFIERFQAWERRPIDQRGPAPELDYRTARDLFGRVLRDYRWFDQYDLALYVDGFLAFEQGREDEARDRFELILREHPSSRFVPDAHMAKGETIFNGRYDYGAALVEYETVLSYKAQIDPALYGLALFKSAWCYWRLGNNDQAARRFVAVFEATDPGAAPGKVSLAQRKQLDELQGEALKYMVEVFTEDEKNTAQDLYNFLTKIGGERFSGKILRALAGQFYDQAHYERGIEAYELLIKLEPTSPEAGRWMLQIAFGYQAIEDWSHLQSSFARAIADYTAGSAWSRAQPGTVESSANVAATTAAIETALREDATALHAKAQKDRTSRAEFDGAAALYGVYLSKFAQEPRAYEIQFYLGEIDFFRLERHLEAAEHYLAAARGIPRSAGSALATMRHDALYNALVALSRLMDTKQDPKTEAEIDNRYAEALDLYAEFYPNDPQLPMMFYRKGKYYFANGNYDAAVKIWGMLLERFPNSEQARDAGDSILESFTRAKNYLNIETWARRLKALPIFGAPKQQERLDALIVQAVFKQGEQQAAAGDHGAAARAYLRAANEFPKDSRAAQACVNAEQEAKLAGDAKMLQEAAHVAMGPAYRDKPESPMGAWLAATTLESMGLLGDAADIAEQMANLGDREHPNYEKYEHERDAAYNAVILREATGEHDRAVLDGTKFLASFGSSAEADEVVFQMGRAHQNTGHAREAAELYKRYLAHANNLDHRVEGFVLLAEAQLKLGDERAAEASLDEAVNLGKHRARDLDPEGKYAAARARYMQGERVLAKFEEIQVQGDVKQLKTRLKRKTDLLKEAAKVFLDCVSMGVAQWSTGALYQIGHMYEAFAKALRDSPPPPDVKTDDQRVDYQAQIEEFAVPMEERSLDAYENGWKKAVELAIYNQWTAKMRDALGRLNSELYPPFRETGFEVQSQGQLPPPPLVSAPARTPAASIPASTPPSAHPSAPASPPPLPRKRD